MTTVLLRGESGWLHFRGLVEVVTAVTPQEVDAALRRVETAVNTHALHAAGFLSYEASAAYQLAVHPRSDSDPPLLWFGLFTEKEEIDEIGDWRLKDAIPNPSPISNLQSPEWQPNRIAASYATAIAAIKDHIAAGDTYQVNFTFPLETPFSGNGLAFFRELVAAQPSDFAAYLDIGSHVICSVSPELFFQLDGDRIWSRPMKGTAVRGLTLAEDNANAVALAQSAKNRAENVMIVDMIRNDLGRVAQVGSVRVPQLFTVERYPTVLQMTSTVTATTTAPVADIFANLFPCASITGAPKVRTMQLIRELEPQPRGLYTGTIGYLSPGRQARFNVAIRTVVVDRAAQQARYGVGSGIVWDSDAAAEYAECLLKAQVLTRKRPSFDLLETLLWQPEQGYHLLDAHLARLADTAVYFNFPFNRDQILAKLTHLPLTDRAKVRLLLSQNGDMRLEATPLLPASTVPVRIGLAREPVASDTVWLYHKTTRREVYAAARAGRPACDDVVLWNERGELTETTIANLVLDLDGVLVTPPVACGLLPGVQRGWELANGRIQEQVLTRADLARARAIYLINSVRGWRQGLVMADVGETAVSPAPQSAGKAGN